MQLLSLPRRCILRTTQPRQLSFIRAAAGAFIGLRACSTVPCRPVACALPRPRASKLRSGPFPASSQPAREDHDDGVEIWAAGSVRALQLIRAARWEDLDDPEYFDVRDPPLPHISPSLHDQLDVVVLTTEQLDWPAGDDRARFCAIPQSQCPPGHDRWHLPDFNTQFLHEQRGFRLQQRSCIVLHLPPWPDGQPRHARAGDGSWPQQPPPLAPRIISLFINGHTLPALGQVVAGHPILYGAMSRAFFPSDDRPGLFMGGIRCNVRQLRPAGRWYQMPPGALNVGYYTANETARKDLADPRSRIHRAFRDTCGGMSEMEAAVAPFVAQRRRGVAELLSHPGILPGIPRAEVPAFAVGASQGFKNHVHDDEMYGGLTGTITWNTAKMPPGSGLTFCIWCAKILFDLQAHPASMVMVPGDVPHGTPGLPPPQQQPNLDPEPHTASAAGGPPAPSARQQQQLHEGYGVVLTTAANLSLQSSKQQLQLLHRRMHDRGPYGRSFQRYRRSQVFVSRSPMYCPTCGEDGRPVPCGEPLCTKTWRGPVRTSDDVDDELVEQGAIAAHLGELITSRERRAAELAATIAQLEAREAELQRGADSRQRAAQARDTSEEV